MGIDVFLQVHRQIFKDQIQLCLLQVCVMFMSLIPPASEHPSDKQCLDVEAPSGGQSLLQPQKAPSTKNLATIPKKNNGRQVTYPLIFRLQFDLLNCHNLPRLVVLALKRLNVGEAEHFNATLKTTPYVPSPSLFSFMKSSKLCPVKFEVILEYLKKGRVLCMWPLLWHNQCD